MGFSAGCVFREPFDDAAGTGELDDTWVHGVLIGGMASPSDPGPLARGYAEAASSLVDTALAGGEPERLCFPIFYLYRHALELHLKDLLPQSRWGHKLEPLIREFEEFLRMDSRGIMPAHVRVDLLTLAAMDPDGQSFWGTPIPARGNGDPRSPASTEDPLRGSTRPARRVTAARRRA